jgi:simple sugar transport system ATP-binding protein
MRIELSQIRKYFGTVRANDGIDMTFEPGRIYGLLGENGAGKSTLMKILSGFQPQDSGEILLDGKHKSFSSPANGLSSGIGMLYQDPLDFPPFNIIDNYLLGLDQRFIPNYHKAAKDLESIAEKYGFDIDIHATIDTLSLGERQQLELIRLLVGGAEVLILDEPTTGISAEQKEKLFDSMRQLAHVEEKTLILVSHKLDEIQELCNYAYVLRRGKLVGGIDVPCRNDQLVEMMFGQLPERSKRPSIQLGESILELKDLAISTYRLSIEPVNLTIRAGEVFGFAGLEGSGQQLVMQACAGLSQSSAGKIIIDGEDVTHWSYHQLQRFGVSYVSAGRLEAGLIAGLTIKEHTILTQPGKEFFINWDKAEENSNKRIAKYQIVGKPDTQAQELSGGNQQRLLFALLNSPLNILLLEQPTRGLDVRSSNWIWELLYQRRDEGTAIVFYSPDLDEIIERSDRIAVFYSGRMSRIVEAQSTNSVELGHLIGGQI